LIAHLVHACVRCEIGEAFDWAMQLDEDRSMKFPAAFLAIAAVAIAMSGNALAEGDAPAGKAIFERTCGNCHSAQIGVNKIGPSLWDVVGRPIASLPDYNYSQKLLSMRGEWKEWNRQNLDRYLTNPREVLHGVKMYFKGLPDAKDRADVIAYLETFK
jgi:cytochrome c